MAVNRYYSSTAVSTSLTAGISGSDVTIAVGATTGFPTSFPYTLCIDPGNGSKELVEVTSAAGLNLTVTRGVDGTSGVSHTLGAVVEHDHSARDFREPQEHIAATTGVHGTTGNLVGDTQTQTLTNKDLSSPSNTFPGSLATDTEVASAVSTHAALTATHGATGAIVGTTNTQALTNKDLTSGTNTFPTSLATDAEVASAIAAALPVGSIIMGGWNDGVFVADMASNLHATSTIPAGYLRCDGSAVSRTTYAALFAVIHTAYGPGDGSTTFNLPNLTGRFPIGDSGGPAATGSFADPGGTSNHTHTLSDAGQAKIDFDTGTSAGYLARVTTASWTAVRRLVGSSVASSSSVFTSGAGLAGNTDSAYHMPPYLTVNFAIKY